MTKYKKYFVYLCKFECDLWLFLLYDLICAKWFVYCEVDTFFFSDKLKLGKKTVSETKNDMPK